MQTLEIICPDDWHIHLRDGGALTTTVTHCAQQFGRAIIMPNLSPPVTTTELALAYRERIIAAIPDGLSFEPLMTLYLTDNTSANELKKAKDSGKIHAVKYYPAGATTNSDAGVTQLEKAFPALDAMQENEIPLLVHGEVTDPEIDIFDREAVFIERVLTPITKHFPALRIVFEHITTSDAVDFVTTAPDNIAATITAHHLMLNRNAILAGGIRPHHYCLPVLKREVHRQALIRAATSGNKKFFIGTDSAPHDVSKKETACGCAGIYTAHAAIEFYAEVFEQNDALDKLEAFTSSHGPDFYRLAQNTDTITLNKQCWTVPDNYALDNGTVIPLGAAQQIGWQLAR